MNQTLLTLIIILIAATAVILVAEENRKENKRWEQFKTEHACSIAGKKDSQSSTGLDSNGKLIVMTTPAQTAWSCNDGVTYWKNN